MRQQAEFMLLIISQSASEITKKYPKLKKHLKFFKKLTENIFLIIIAPKSVYIFGVMQWQIKNSYCSPLDIVEIDDEGNVKVNGKVINEQISKKKAVNKNKHRIAMFISMLAILIVIGVSWRLKKS